MCAKDPELEEVHQKQNPRQRSTYDYSNILHCPWLDGAFLSVEDRGCAVLRILRILNVT